MGACVSAVRGDDFPDEEYIIKCKSCYRSLGFTKKESRRFVEYCKHCDG